MTTVVIGGYTDRHDAPPGIPSGLALHECVDGDVRETSILAIPNPTWFEWDAPRRVLYVSQSSLTTLTAVWVPGGPSTARVLDVIDIGAINPAHLAVAPTRDAVVAACFDAGQVVTIGLDAAGRFRGVRGRTDLAIVGNAEPHQIVFDQRGAGFVVPDRAQDMLHRFTWDHGRSPRWTGSDPVPAGRGPRHLVQHPARDDIAYLAGEFDSTLTTLRSTERRFHVVRAESTIPRSFDSENSVAAISLAHDASRLLVSNRGHDSLALFEISNPLVPRLQGWIPVRGRTPRFAAEVAPGVTAIAALDTHAVDFVTDVDAAREGGGFRGRFAHVAPACVRIVNRGEPRAARRA